MAWEEHSGGFALDDVLGEGRDDGDCRFAGGDKVLGGILVKRNELRVGGSCEIDCVELALAESQN